MLRLTSSVFLRLVSELHIADNMRADFSSHLITASVSLVWRLTQLKAMASEHQRHSQYGRWRYPEIPKINHMVTLLLLSELLGVSLTHSKNESEGRDLLWEVWAGQPDLSAGTSQMCSAMSYHSSGGTRHFLRLWLVVRLSLDYPDVSSQTLFTHAELENPGAAVFGKITPLSTLWCLQEGRAPNFISFW